MRLSPRSILIGLAAIVVVCLVVSWAELVTGQIMIGFLQLPPVAVAGLFALVLVNKALRAISPRLSLHPRELAVVYCMMLIASMVSSRGLMEDLLPTLVGVNYYANPGNRWQELFFGHIRPWMVPWEVFILQESLSVMLLIISLPWAPIFGSLSLSHLSI